MAVSIWRPFEDMLSLREAMDRLFESSFVRPREGAEAREASLPADMYETEDAVVIQARVPGVNPDNLEITATEEAITIRGALRTNALEEKAKDWHWYRRELWTGNFSRVLPLPTRVQIDKVDANFEHGLLTLTIPKAEEVRPRTIKVNVK